jgi:hypothetical protein
MSDYVLIPIEDLEKFPVTKITTARSFYLELLIMAGYEPFITTTRRLANRFNLTTDQVRKWLNMMDDDLISMTRGKGREITIRILEGEEIGKNGAKGNRVY